MTTTLKQVIAAYSKADKSEAKGDADRAAAFVLAHTFLGEDGNTLRSLEDGLGIKRSQIQRHDLAGFVLSLEGDVTTGDEDLFPAAYTLKVVTGAVNRVGVPTVRETIASCTTSQAAVEAVDALGRNVPDETGEDADEAEGGEAAEDEGEVEDDFSIALGMVERAVAQAIHARPLVPFTEAEAARLSAIVDAFATLVGNHD